MMNTKENSDETVIIPSQQIRGEPYFSNLGQYQELYHKSIKDPEQFWSNVCKQFHWKSEPRKVLDYNFDISKGHVFIKWMDGAFTNMCYNVLDRHIKKGRGNRIAYHWEGNDGKTKRSITYTELRAEVCKFANALKSLGIKRGDRIAIYMPVSIDCVVAMLACARIAAVHSVMFEGLSAESLAERIIDARCVLLISCDGCYRAEKLIPIKNITDSALDICRQRGYQKISNIVSKHLKLSSKEDNQDYDYKWNDQVDIWWDDFIKNKPDSCQPAWVNAEQPLFILYTSGSTGKPKALVHTIGGYLLHSYLAFKYVYNYKEGDVFFSTFDLAWIVGHAYAVYGGLANCATIVLMEGTPYFPKSIRVWEIIERLRVNIFYTVPTLIRVLKEMGDHFVKAYKLSSLKVVAVTSEANNRQTWDWLLRTVGDHKCPIVDSYGQTETGVLIISSIPGCPMKPGSASLPFFGCLATVLDDNGLEIEGPAEGNLVFKKPWPGMARTIDGDHQLYEKNYFQKFPGYYWTGDYVRRDVDGYYWIIGRNSDFISVSGYNLSILAMEWAIIEHKGVAEVAVVSAPHSLKGEVPFVFVVPNSEYKMTADFEIDIKNKVRQKIGAHAQPDVVLQVSGLPKTKTGKVLHRILYNIIRNNDLGDTSALDNNYILDEIYSKISIEN